MERLKGLGNVRHIKGPNIGTRRYVLTVDEGRPNISTLPTFNRGSQVLVEPPAQNVTGTVAFSDAEIDAILGKELEIQLEQPDSRRLRFVIMFDDRDDRTITALGGLE